VSAAQHEHLPPTGYVQALPVVTHGDAPAPEGVDTMALTGHPAIVRALNLIREDNGGPSWPPESSPLIAKAWEPHLAAIEAAIGSLSDTHPPSEDPEACERFNAGERSYLDSELYTFCNGESTVVAAMAAHSEGLRLANAFLNDFFEGWAMGVPA
jgi:hypothetical protein